MISWNLMRGSYYFQSQHKISLRELNTKSLRETSRSLLYFWQHYFIYSLEEEPSFLCLYFPPYPQPHKSTYNSFLPVLYPWVHRNCQEKVKNNNMATLNHDGASLFIAWACDQCKYTEFLHLEV